MKVKNAILALGVFLAMLAGLCAYGNEKGEFTGVVTLPGGVPLKMIKVEPGSFMMGSENG